MATRTGTEDRWVGGREAASLCHCGPSPLRQHMRFEQDVCCGVSLALWRRPFGWCHGLHRYITEVPHISIHQEASGEKREVVPLSEKLQ